LEWVGMECGLVKSRLRKKFKKIVMEKLAMEAEKAREVNVAEIFKDSC